jgi:hypothetical protein
VAFGYFWQCRGITFIALALATLSFAVVVLTALAFATLSYVVAVLTVLALATLGSAVAVLTVLALATLADIGFFGYFGNAEELHLVPLPWQPWVMLWLY